MNEFNKYDSNEDYDTGGLDIVANDAKESNDSIFIIAAHGKINVKSKNWENYSHGVTVWDDNPWAE